MAELPGECRSGEETRREEERGSRKKQEGERGQESPTQGFRTPYPEVKQLDDQTAHRHYLEDTDKT